MNPSHRFKDFKNIDNEEDEMKPTLLNSKALVHASHVIFHHYHAMLT